MNLIEEVRFGIAPVEKEEPFRMGNHPDRAKRKGSQIVTKRRDLHLLVPF
jgi:hypothetical protein